MRSGTRGLVAVTVGWAVIGLLVGHIAAYDLVYPDAHVHAAALAESGHAWLGMLEPSLLTALAFVVVFGTLAARAGQPHVVRFRRLAVVQIGAFVLVELGERVLAGHPPTHLVHEVVDHGLWLVLCVGILVQVITAWLGSMTSRGIASAATRPPSTLPRRTRRAPVIAMGNHMPFDRRPRSQLRGRAPPSSLLSRQ